MSNDLNNEKELYKYTGNHPTTAFFAEDRMTEQMKKTHLQQKGYKQLGYFPNLKHPESFNEKIMWLALYYKNDEIRTAVDKATAKDWIKNRVGEGYTIDLCGVYTDVDDIDFDTLPDKFVAKLNDGWGANEVMIVRDKNSLDKDMAMAVMSSWLYPWKNYYYKNMCVTDQKMECSKIVIEKFIESDGPLTDYKIYCLNGTPKFTLVVDSRKSEDESRTFVDMDWKVMNVQRNLKQINPDPPKPEKLDKMIELAKKLSEGFPLVRIDFYEEKGQIYIGELTFIPGMFLRFEPKEADFELGKMLDIEYLMH